MRAANTGAVTPAGTAPAAAGGMENRHHLAPRVYAGVLQLGKGIPPPLADIATVIRGERPTAATFAGGALVLTGMLVAGLLRPDDARPRPAPLVELETP